jgi:hypothetical protein
MESGRISERKAMNLRMEQRYKLKKAVHLLNGLPVNR